MLTHTFLCQSDENLFDYNVNERVDSFIQACKDQVRMSYNALQQLYSQCLQAQHYRTDNIMIMMGEDFNYENANTYYKTLDKLLYYVNKVSAV